MTAPRDIVTRETRSRMMSAVRQHGTEPELAVREVVRELGGHYRLNNRRLPGSPDLSNIRAGWAIFVHGCFWHGHRNCPKTKGGRQGRIPALRSDFWTAKLDANRARDARKRLLLRTLGIRVLTVWECEVKNTGRLRRRLSRFLDRI